MPEPVDHFHMSPEEFRLRGREVIDWIADYLEHVEQFAVQSQVRPGEIRAKLPDAPPETGEPFDHVLRDLEEIVLPGLTHWQHPSFFAFFPANASGPAILGDLLASGLGVQGMLWATSPACTELETHLLDWLVGMLDLPEQFLSTTAGGGVIQDTASSASLCALLAARERATNYHTNIRGVDRPLIAYASTQAHSSIEKAMMIAGLGRAHLRLVDVDESFAMRPEALAAAIDEDLTTGHIPFFCCATVGTTSSNAMDPVRPIAAVCREHGLWLHVDAAMSGTAALCPEFRWIHDGLDGADSYCFNPHKWMLTNFDCDCFWVADRAALIRTLSVLPEYLKNKATESGQVFDYRDWHIPLGRRFRALKLWLVIRHYGVAGLQRHVREGVALAQEFAAWVKKDPRFELVVEPPLTLVCFRHVDGDDATRRVLEQVNETGRAYLTHTKLGGHYAIRMSLGGTWTERRHVEAAWQLIQAAAE